MAVCDMCGKEGMLVPAIVEGTELRVCMSCKKFGKVLQRPQAVKKQTVVNDSPVESVVDSYAQLIREARERQGLTQKEFAQRLNEKESLVQKWEAASLVPPVATARKLEKLLKIRLVEVEKEGVAQAQKKSSGPLTIGDLMTKK